jgi:hypothetical protein
MILNKILSQRDDIAWKEIDKQIVLMDLGSNKMVHRLNNVGSFIWKRLDGLRNLESIKLDICDEYSISPEIAERDLTEFVTVMQDLGVVIGS